MNKNDILNELASMGLEADYIKTISVMLDEFEESIRKDCKKEFTPPGAARWLASLDGGEW